MDSVIVEEVIVALTGAGAGASPADLRQQMERAATNFDNHTAESFGHALLERLTVDPGDVRALEALLILGLAHPKQLERKRIPLVREGRRLAVLLEKQGDCARAQTLLELLTAHAPGDRAVEGELAGVMRRNGNLARLVERNLRRAEEATREGRRDEAVRWLREVLMFDSSRRDVARMIRDLRFEDAQIRAAWRKRLRIAALTALIAATLGAACWREFDIDAMYAAIPQAPKGDVVAMQARLTTIDAMIDRVGGLGPGPGGPGPGPRGGPVPLIEPGALATFLGVEPSAIRTAMQGGKSLAVFAQERGKTREQLKTFLTEKEKAALDAAVKSGRLTQARADEMMKNGAARIDAMIDRIGHPGPGPGRGPGPGPRGMPRAAA